MFDHDAAAFKSKTHRFINSDEAFQLLIDWCKASEMKKVDGEREERGREGRKWRTEWRIRERETEKKSERQSERKRKRERGREWKKMRKRKNSDEEMERECEREKKIKKEWDKEEIEKLKRDITKRESEKREKRDRERKRGNTLIAWSVALTMKPLKHAKINKKKMIWLQRKSQMFSLNFDRSRF